MNKFRILYSAGGGIYIIKFKRGRWQIYAVIKDGPFAHHIGPAVYPRSENSTPIQYSELIDILYR